MQPIEIKTVDGLSLAPRSVKITCTSLFPHVAVVDVTMLLDKLPAVVIIEGQPNVPSMRALVDGAAATDFEITSHNVTLSRMILHTDVSYAKGKREKGRRKGAEDPIGEASTHRSVTLQWHASFVPVDQRFAFTIPNVFHSAVKPCYSIALNWGFRDTTTTLVSRSGDIVKRRVGEFEDTFSFGPNEGNKMDKRETCLMSLAMFVTTPNSHDPHTGTRNTVVSILRGGRVWILFAFVTFVAAVIIQRLLH